MTTAFNYHTKSDPVSDLIRQVFNIKKTLRALKIWEVNDISLGTNILRRRQVRPMPDSGTIVKGPWFDFTDLSGLSGLSGSSNYSDWAFGFTMPDTEIVPVNAGRLRHGARTVVGVASAKITISDTVNQTWIFVSYTFGAGAVISSSTAEPQSTETVYNHALHKWLLVGGKAVLQSVCCLGDISIPGSFG
jgi:hypothetical protein